MVAIDWLHDFSKILCTSSTGSWIFPATYKLCGQTISSTFKSQHICSNPIDVEKKPRFPEYSPESYISPEVDLIHQAASLSSNHPSRNVDFQLSPHHRVLSITFSIVIELLCLAVFLFIYSCGETQGTSSNLVVRMAFGVKGRVLIPVVVWKSKRRMFINLINWFNRIFLARG